MERIGEGGMGTVYKGSDPAHQREVAIKVLRPDSIHQPELIERFRSEALLLGRLNHPNITAFYNFVCAEDRYFIVMEYVSGKTLEKIMAEAGALPLEQAWSLFEQILSAVRHAHQAGIIHRDLKPGNVMITADNTVKVTDFGIAKSLREVDDRRHLTRDGRAIGTVEYMSPEQIRGERLDERADIYSLGVMLYEMLTGRLPFRGNGDFEIMQAHLTLDPSIGRETTSHLPQYVRTVLGKAMAKKPKHRFQTVDEFRTSLFAATETAAPARSKTYTRAATATATALILMGIGSINRQCPNREPAFSQIQRDRILRELEADSRDQIPFPALPLRDGERKTDRIVLPTPTPQPRRRVTMRSRPTPVQYRPIITRPSTPASAPVFRKSEPKPTDLIINQ
jgi:serine/threonine protein kinase